MPETSTAGDELRIPLVIRAGSEPLLWDNAALRIETEGPVVATADIDATALEAESSLQGMLTVRVQPGTADELTTGRAFVALELRDGNETTTARRVEFGLIADDRTTWLGHVSPRLLKLDRLQSLLDTGEISPTEYEEARTEILETVSGTVETLDD